MCMYIGMYVHVHIQASVCMSVHTGTCTCICIATWVCLYYNVSIILQIQKLKGEDIPLLEKEVTSKTNEIETLKQDMHVVCVSVCTYVYICVYIYMCVCPCLYVHVHVCMCVYTCISDCVCVLSQELMAH